MIGMLFGAAVYAEVHPWMKSSILGVGDIGKKSIADLTGISPWWLIVALAVIAAGVFVALEIWESRTRMGHDAKPPRGTPAAA